MLVIKQKMTRAKLDAFIQKNASDQYTLDLGCGGSRYSKYFSNRVGFDIQKMDGVDVVGDMHQLPFKDETFDVVLCTEVLEHSHSPQVAIKEMRRVLKRGGSLILTTRFIFPLHDVPHDYFRYTKYGLRKLLSSGWEITEFEPESDTFGALGVLLQRMVYQVKYKGNRLIKLILLFIANLLLFLGKFVKIEFGDIEQKEVEKDILSSGYYLVAKKK